MSTAGTAQQTRSGAGNAQPTRRGASNVLHARYSAVAFRAFDLLFRPWRNSRLRLAPILGLPSSLPADRPLLIVANHTSWWDGFLLRDVHEALRPGAPMYSIMTERELRRLPLLRILGALPLHPGSPASLLRLIRCLRSVAHVQPACTILFFPQGRIWPAWRRPLGFERGVELIIRALGECAVLPAGLHIESLNRSSPTAFLSLGQILNVPEQSVTADALEAAVGAQLDGLARLLSDHGESAVQHLHASQERARWSR